MPEIIVFNGIKFRRYPNSKKRTSAVYYTPGAADRQAGVKRLHQEIWMAANGPIPKGWHVHHKDDDPLNNDLANLEALPRKVHMHHHNAGKCSPRKLEHLAEIRPLAAAWHSSAEGLEWHSKHAYQSIRSVAPTEHVCEQCGATFVTVPKKSNRFCSNNCKSISRRLSGVDDEQRTCVQCGSGFTCNRYAKKKTCSTECAGKFSAAVRRGKPQRSRH